MNEWMLTIKEIREAKREVCSSFPNAKDEGVCKVQVRKIVEWGLQTCREHYPQSIRFLCFECMEQLRKEIQRGAISEEL
jgi:hypothetical protein